VYNSWYLLFFSDDCLLSWLEWNNPTRTTKSQLKRIISTNCCTHTVVPHDDGSRYVRNMYRLTKYTKNKLCIKLVFFYTFVTTINLLTPNVDYCGRTAPLTSKCCILYIYSTNTGTEYFKHAIYSPFFLFKMQFVS